jgi:hypothetical protein
VPGREWIAADFVDVESTRTGGSYDPLDSLDGIDVGDLIIAVLTHSVDWHSDAPHV